MKIEFVEFYPNRSPKKDSKTLGTAHIYLIKEQIDIRGIRVVKRGKSLAFQMPYTWTTDEKGNRIRYPNVSFMQEETHKALFSFLQVEVGPKIMRQLKVSPENGQ